MFRRVLGAIFLLVLLIGLLVLLTVTAPLAAGVSRPTILSGWLGLAAPYAIVALLGLIVGWAELSSTFPNYPIEAISSGWGLFLLGLNSIVATIAFAIARYYAPDMNLFLLVLAVGIGFQSLIRTRFVLAREFGEGGEGRDLSFNLGWLYEQFQTLCKTQIDLSLMRNRESSVRTLAACYPDVKLLYNLAYYTILARGTLSKEEERAKLQELTDTMSNKALPLDVVQMAMALAILEIGGQGFAELLCRAPMSQKPPQAQVATQMASQDALVAELVGRYDLDGLAALARKAVDMASAGENREVLEQFVSGTRADDKASEQARKTILARFVVEKGGPAFIEKLSATLPQPPTP